MSDSLFPFEWLDQQAKVQPDKTFLIYQNTERQECILTYQEVALATDKLAYFLKNHYPSNTIVSIHMPRGVEYVIAMFAAWKAQMIFMPFTDDPRNKDITKFIRHLEIAQRFFNTSYLLISNSRLDISSEHQIVFNEQFIKNLSTLNISDDYFSKLLPHSLSDPAYICCSSGTTSDPKLILNKYEGFLERVRDIANQVMGEKIPHCVLGFSSGDFDAYVMDILMTVFKGASLYIVPNEVKASVYTELPKLFQKRYQQNQPITVAVLVPGILSGSEDQGLNPCDYPGLSNLITMGDHCKKNWLLPWLKTSVKVFNGYGPTEATIIAMYSPIHLSDEAISLGKPYQGAIIYLRRISSNNTNTITAIITPETTPEQLIALSQSLEGEIFELVIGGKGIGSYLHSEEANNAAFYQKTREDWPFKESNRVYATNDLVSFHQGKLYFQGRRDRLIKRNGVRVFLNDIEQKFNHLPIESIHLVKVEKFIIAYVHTLKLTDSEITKLLYAEHDKLEQSIKPDFYIALPTPPILQTARNKLIIDPNAYKRKDARLLKKSNNSPCQTVAEKDIAALFAQLLFPEDFPFIESIISREDDFFNLGGDSLDISKLITLLWKKFFPHKLLTQIPFDFLNYIYRNPTIQAIASFIETYGYDAAKIIKSGNDVTIFYLCNLGEPKSSFLRESPLIKTTICQLIPRDLIINDDLKPSPQRCDMMIAQCLRALYHQQEVGPYHFIAGEKDLPFLSILIQQITNAETYVSVHQSQAIENNPRVVTTREWAAAKQAKKNNWQVYEEDQLVRIILENETLRQTSKLYNKLEKYHKKISKLPPNKNNLPFINSLKTVIEGNKQKTLFLSGSPRKGKRTLSQLLYSELWQYYGVDKVKHILPILIDLRGENSPDPIRKILFSEGFDEEDLACLHAIPLIFIILGYGEMARNDYLNIPKTLQEFSQAKFFIPIRNTITEKHLSYTWHHDEYSLVTMPDNAFFFDERQIEKGEKLQHWLYNELLRLQACGRYISNVELKTFIQYLSSNKLPIKLLPMPSSWEKGQLTHHQKTYYAMLKHRYFPLLCSLLQQQEDGSFQYPKWIEEETQTVNNEIVSAELTEEDILFLNLNRPTELVQLLSPQELQNTIAINPSFVPINTGQHLTPIFFFHPLTGSVPNDYRNLAKLLGFKQPVYCFTMSKENDSYATQLRDKADYFANQILKIQPKGSLLLVGWSYGAMLAYRTAAILEKKRKIALLLNIDCSSPAAMQDIHAGTRSISIIAALSQPDFYKIDSHISLSEEKLIARIKKDENLFSKLKKELTPAESQEIIKEIFNLAISYYKTEQSEVKEKGGLKRLIDGLECSKINLMTCYQAAEENYKLEHTTLHIAEPDHTPGINPGPNKMAGYRWLEIVNNNEERLKIQHFDDCDHYSIFQQPQFLQYFRKLTQDYQARLESLPLNTRLARYLKQIKGPTVYIEQEVIQNNEKAGKREPLQSKINNFLASKNNTLLLYGEPGTGKTLFLQHLNTKLSKSYLEQKTEENWIPFYIKLHNKRDNLVIDTLRTIFTEHEIHNDIKYRPVIFLLDGFDEAGLYENFYLLNQLEEWPRVKVIFTTRSNYIHNKSYRQYFVDQSNNLEEFSLLEFGLRQIFDYFNAIQELLSEEDRTYLFQLKEILNTHPDLKLLATNPLMLSILLRIMPTLIHQQQKRWTKTEIYQLFMADIFSKGEQRIFMREGVSPGVNLLKSFQQYHQKISFEIVINNKHTQQELRAYFTPDKDTRQARDTDLLNVKEGIVEFEHKTYLEYFVASNFVEQWIQDPQLFERQIKRYINNHKYDPNFESIWIFMCGLLHKKNQMNLLNTFFNTFLETPHESTGLNTVLLITRCLNETMLASRIDARKKITDYLYKLTKVFLSENHLYTALKITFFSSLRLCPFVLAKSGLIDLIKRQIHSSYISDIDEKIESALEGLSYLGVASEAIINRLCFFLEDNDIFFEDYIKEKIFTIRKLSARSLQIIGDNRSEVITALVKRAEKTKKYPAIERMFYEEALWHLNYPVTNYGQLLEQAQFMGELTITEKIMLSMASVMDVVFDHGLQQIGYTPESPISFEQIIKPKEFIQRMTAARNQSLDNSSITNQQWDIPLVMVPLLNYLKTTSDFPGVSEVLLSTGTKREGILNELLRQFPLTNKENKTQILKILSANFMHTARATHFICSLILYGSKKEREMAFEVFPAINQIDNKVIKALETSFSKESFHAINAAKKFSTLNPKEIIPILCKALQLDFELVTHEASSILKNYDLTPYLSYLSFAGNWKLEDKAVLEMFHSTPLLSLIQFYVFSRSLVLMQIIFTKIVSQKFNFYFDDNFIYFQANGIVQSVPLNTVAQQEFLSDLMTYWRVRLAIPTFYEHLSGLDTVAAASKVDIATLLFDDDSMLDEFLFNNFSHNHTELAEHFVTLIKHHTKVTEKTILNIVRYEHFSPIFLLKILSKWSCRPYLSSNFNSEEIRLFPPQEHHRNSIDEMDYMSAIIHNYFMLLRMSDFILRGINREETILAELHLIIEAVRITKLRTSICEINQENRTKLFEELDENVMRKISCLKDNEWYLLLHTRKKNKKIIMLYISFYRQGDEILIFLFDNTNKKIPKYNLVGKWNIHSLQQKNSVNYLQALYCSGFFIDESSEIDTRHHVWAQILTASLPDIKPELKQLVQKHNLILEEYFIVFLASYSSIELPLLKKYCHYITLSQGVTDAANQNTKKILKLMISLPESMEIVLNNINYAAVIDYLLIHEKADDAQLTELLVIAIKLFWKKRALMDFDTIDWDTFPTEIDQSFIDTHEFFHQLNDTDINNFGLSLLFRIAHKLYYKEDALLLYNLLETELNFQNDSASDTIIIPKDEKEHADQFITPSLYSRLTKLLACQLKEVKDAVMYEEILGDFEQPIIQTALFTHLKHAALQPSIRSIFILTMLPFSPSYSDSSYLILIVAPNQEFIIISPDNFEHSQDFIISNEMALAEANKFTANLEKHLMILWEYLLQLQETLTIRFRIVIRATPLIQNDSPEDYCAMMVEQTVAEITGIGLSPTYDMEALKAYHNALLNGNSPLFEEAHQFLHNYLPPETVITSLPESDSNILTTEEETNQLELENEIIIQPNSSNIETITAPAPPPLALENQMHKPSEENSDIPAIKVSHNRHGWFNCRNVSIVAGSAVVAAIAASLTYQ